MGVDIGGSKINVGLLNLNGEILINKKMETRAYKSPKNIINEICNIIKIIINDSNVPIEKINSVGFGIPGTVQSQKGIVVYAPNLGWKNFQFAKNLIDKFPFEIYLGQDTRAAAIAEYLFGAGKNCKNIVCMTLGTGIGAGIIIDKKIYFGSFGTAGEIGHMIVKINGNKCKCGKKGCLEAHASGTYISRRAKKLFNELNYTIDEKRLSEDLFLLANKGNKKALKIKKEIIQYTGIGLVNILNILGPDKIIISGGMSKEQDFIEELGSFVKKNGYEVAADKIQVVKAALGEFSPMIGAAMLFTEKAFKYIG